MAFAVVLGVGAVVVRDARKRRRQDHERQAVLQAVQLVGAELEAGARLPDALAAAEGVDDSHAGAWRDAAAAARAGHDPAVPLAAAVDAHVAALGHALRIAGATGAPVAGVIGEVVADLVQLEERRRAVRVAVAGPRGSALLLAALPVVGIGLGVLMGARPFEFLGGSSGGRLVACAGVVLDAAGILWMRRIVRAAEVS